MVDNQTGAPQAITFTGTLVTPACAGGSGNYAQTATCDVGQTACLTLSGLASGVWTHQITTGSQNQFKKSLIVAADPSGTPNTVAWVAFATVLTVDRTDDISSNPTPHCPSAPGNPTCTLRQAMLAGATAPAPLLVQFDPVVFPAGTPTTVQLTQSKQLPIAGSGMLVDGTDPDGNPTFRGDPLNRIVRLPSRGGAFAFTNPTPGVAGAGVAGLFIQRPLLSIGAPSPGDVIIFSGSGTQQNRVVNCKVDGGAGGLPYKRVAQDCVQGVSGAGGPDWSQANTVQNTEIAGCADKGVKVTTLAYLQVKDSWVHNNIGGGIQATLSGNIEADDNIVEYNGYNATAKVFPSANGLAANGANTGVHPTTPNTPSVLHTNGNMIRSNSSHGISVRGASQAVLTNDLACGAVPSGQTGQNGISIFYPTAITAASLRGSASIYNGRDGLFAAAGTAVDLGQDNPNGGNNAFTQNATIGKFGGRNLWAIGALKSLPARGNQWQHCYADPTKPAAVCDGSLSLDVKGAAADVTSPQAYRADGTALPVVINSVSPTKGTAGDLIHISGSGFNAIDSYPAGGNCTTTVQQNNTCGSPIVGNCVQYEASPGVWANFEVESVTPTEIVVAMPPGVNCAQPVTVRVQRLDYTGAVVSTTATFCTNS